MTREEIDSYMKELSKKFDFKVKWPESHPIHSRPFHYQNPMRKPGEPDVIIIDHLSLLKNEK
jgi:hypothetical protein